MPAHTPGPWMYETDVQDDEPQHVIVGGLAKHEGAVIVARLHHSETSDAEANARLIAAAPALLEALEEIAKGEGAFSRDPLTHASNTIDNMKEIARAALALAKGETS